MAAFAMLSFVSLAVGNALLAIATLCLNMQSRLFFKSHKFKEICFTH